MPAVPGGRPARPAGRRAVGPGRRSPPGIPRLLLPAFPSGRAGPPARPRPAGPSLVPACAPAWPLSVAPRGGSPGWVVWAGGGLDGVGGGERASWRAHGRAAPTPPDASGTADDRLLTIEEVIAELRVSRAAFYRWRRAGAGPAVVRLPGGGVRVRRSALSAWLRGLEAETREGQEQAADG
jgi:predicted DNA-binding transcriptional regulator AlpA